MRWSCLLILVSLPAAPVAAQPAITFESAAVLTSGMTPGGQVIWFGVARESEDHAARIVRRQTIVTAGPDGAARLDLDRDVPFTSLWVAIDLATGTTAVATPDGFPLRQIDLPGPGVVSGDNSDELELTLGYVELLVVRPGVGAWGVTAGDGGEMDDDGRYDGQVAVSFAHLRSAGTGPDAPQRFLAHDVVVAIDPNQMQVAVSQLASVAR